MNKLNINNKETQIVLNKKENIETLDIIQNNISKLEIETTDFFGIMRNATSEELNSIDSYIKNISKETGTNFFDLC